MPSGNWLDRHLTIQVNTGQVCKGKKATCKGMNIIWGAEGITAAYCPFPNWL